jgi:putative hydrolase of the HAD superfamily
VRVRAVIFDLWDTLVEYPSAEARRIVDRAAQLAPVGAAEFGRLWQASYRASQTGPLGDLYRSLGVPDQHVEPLVEAWRDFGRRALRPRAATVEGLRALRRLGVRLAVLSACSEEVPAAWPGSGLAGLFDVETFSSVCGLMKPDAEIYLHTSGALEVDPADCLFVGDGANDELAGAARVGMTPVLFAPGPPRWPEVRDWRGLRVSTIQEVVSLC